MRDRDQGLYRVLDANFNRAKEGLRVCEEITRFILNSTALTARLKRCRHRIDSLTRSLPGRRRLFAERDSGRDVGLKVKQKSEFKRNGFKDIFFANIQRVKESIRVLEEFAKLDDVAAALGFRNLRYEIYELEKDVSTKLASACRRR
ncbi:MAG: thiamine-phosphate pyrophosphorylase [Candidatus Omnitrophica bacterium]|nr:thiamine-phosphate pyrophosphorylase [Candidatus Omnitrophota bacterium]